MRRASGLEGKEGRGKGINLFHLHATIFGAISFVATAGGWNEER